MNQLNLLTGRMTDQSGNLKELADGFEVGPEGPPSERRELPAHN